MVEAIKGDVLIHCIYVSAASRPFSDKELVELLALARKNNKSLGITGMLLYEDGSFFQVLEGKASVVNQLLEIIEQDERHERVVKLIYEAIERRDFSQWTMGYAKAVREDLKKVDGLSDFFLSGKHYVDLSQGRAKTLLTAFKEGKWHSGIT